MRSRLLLTLLAATAVLLALAFTAPVGSANQATYLLDPLHRAFPELWRRDWFIATPPYLPVFGWLAEWLYRIDGDGIASVLAAHVAITIATYVALFWVVTAIARDLRVCLLVAGFSTLTMGRAMGGSYLFTPYLQPSSLATLGWVWALGALLRGRYLMCGVALALAGAVHPNFLVLGFGLFALAGLARRGVTVRDAACLLVPQLIVLAVYAPQLLAATGATDQAVRLLVEFHAPGHFDGLKLAVRIPEIALWLVAAYAALRALDATPELRMLWRFSLIAGAIVSVTAALIAIPALQGLTQAFWSRMAPYALFGCQVIVAAALVRPVRWTVAAWFAPAIVATLFYDRGTPLMIIGGAVALTAAVLARRPSVLVVVVLAAALWKSPRGRGLDGRLAVNRTELALETWSREHTPVDALFLIPPELGRFRLLSRRAVVVDTKSPPLRADLLVAWYQRLCAVARVDSARTTDEIVARYHKLSADELADVAHRFGADYIVVRAPMPGLGVPEFANDAFAVYRVP